MERRRGGGRGGEGGGGPGVDAGLGDVPDGRGLHDVPDDELPDGLVLGAALGEGGGFFSRRREEEKWRIRGDEEKRIRRRG